jgi:hypothetical protein
VAKQKLFKKLNGFRFNYRQKRSANNVYKATLGVNRKFTRNALVIVALNRRALTLALAYKNNFWFLDLGFFKVSAFKNSKGKILLR